MGPVGRPRHAALGADNRSPAAVTLLIAGRALMVAGIAAITLCRMTYSLWATAPVTQDSVIQDHWIPQGTFVVAFAWSLLLPLLVLPVGSVALTSVDEKELRIRTVLGTRVLSRATLKGTPFRLPGRRHGLEMTLLRDSRHLPALVAGSEFWPVGGEDVPSQQGWQRGRTSHRRMASRRLLSVAVGWLIMAIWSVTSLAVFAAAGAAALVFQ